MASKNNHPDQKRPATALGKFLLEKNQLRLIDLTLNKTPPEILQHPPFFTGRHLESLFATREQQKQKKERRKKPTTSTGTNTGRNKNSYSLKARRQKPHGLTAMGTQAPGGGDADKVYAWSLVDGKSLGQKEKKREKQ